MIILITGSKNIFLHKDGFIPGDPVKARGSYRTQPELDVLIVGPVYINNYLPTCKL